MPPERLHRRQEPAEVHVTCNPAACGSRRAGTGRVVIMMCGLPASGKTTTAVRLHAQRDGVLIRSCDIYQELGIVLPEWGQAHGWVHDQGLGI